MKVLKKTDEYIIYQKRSGRYAVEDAFKKIIVLPSNYKLTEKDILYIRDQLILIIKKIKPNFIFKK